MTMCTFRIFHLIQLYTDLYIYVIVINQHISQ